MTKPILFALLFVPALSQAEPFQCSTRVKQGEEVTTGQVTVNLDVPGYLEINGAREDIGTRAEAKITGVADYAKAMNACTEISNAGKLACSGAESEEKQAECNQAAEHANLECGTAAMNLLIPEDSEEAMIVKMAKLGVMFMKLQQDAPADERNTEIEIDITKIASVKAYQVGKESKWGVPGLYEYFDAAGASLGRYLIATPYVVPCK